MSEGVNVYAPGEKAMIADGKIEAIISCVALYAHGGVLYEVVWWHDGSRHSVWASEHELGIEQDKRSIGFKVK